MSRSILLWMPVAAVIVIACLASCGDEGDGLASTPRVQAVVASDRTGHLLDRPYPSDELLTADGTIDLSGFPLVGPSIGKGFMRGWLRQIRSSVRGFSAMTPIYFRFDARPAVSDRYESAPSDAIRLFSLDSVHRVPINVHFVDSDEGDPYTPPNTLVLAPDERYPLRSGERYAAVVSAAVARPAPGWVSPRELVGQELGVGTVFTVQQHRAELEALRRATDAFLADNPQALLPPDGLREVSALHFTQGTTPSGQPATVERVDFADGGSAITYLDDKREAATRDIDLRGGPMAVYQAMIQTVAFQDPKGRPYQHPGLGIISDTNRSDGWIAFAGGAELRSVPHAEPMRIVVQVPRRTRRFAVLLWGHGSGGDAYEAIARTEAADDIEGIRQAVADAGALIVSLDQPLFGQRFPLIDLGYSKDLAVVNVPNLPAFRDTVRQGAVDQYVLLQFARNSLDGLLGGGQVDRERIGLFGHSIGAQMAGINAGLTTGLRGVFMNGSGGFVAHSVLASDLLALGGGGTATAIFGLAGIDAPDNPTPAAILGALFGVPAEAWPRIDRHHPLALPFQLVIDAADPLAVAAEHAIPATVFYGQGDGRVPADGAAWLAAASRNAHLVRCDPASDYDGHYCIFRAPRGREALAAFVGSL